MRRGRTMRSVFALGLAAACGGAPPTSTEPGGADREGRMRSAATRLPATGEDTFGPLEVGADYASYRKVTDKPFQSLDHGNRWVEVYVNEIGAAAYLSSTMRAGDRSGSARSRSPRGSSPRRRTRRGCRTTRCARAAAGTGPPPRQAAGANGRACRDRRQGRGGNRSATIHSVRPAPCSPWGGLPYSRATGLCRR